MVMLTKKTVIFILVISVLIISGLYFWTNRPEPLREDGLTERQYQWLLESTITGILDEMNDIEIRNAWLILDNFNRIGFVENTAPGQSSVTHATWILDMLGIGEIKDLSIEVYQYDPMGLSTMLTLRIVNNSENIYYARFGQTWGIGSVFEDSLDGNLIYNNFAHQIRNGQICERWYPYNCRIGR